MFHETKIVVICGRNSKVIKGVSGVICDSTDCNSLRYFHCERIGMTGFESSRGSHQERSGRVLRG